VGDGSEDTCRIQSSTESAWRASYIDNDVSGGRWAGSDRIVQSMQLAHTPGFVQEKADDDAAVVTPLCWAQPGQLQSSPQLQAEGNETEVLDSFGGIHVDGAAATISSALS
jgi:hypothetical protein